MIPTLDELLAEDALADLRTRPIAELRALRSRCAAAESDVSFVRRIAQGRLDIVGHEVQRRTAGGPPADLNDILFDLPDILADPVTGGAPSGRSLAVNAPGSVAVELVDRLDATASPNDLSTVGGIDDDRLQVLFERIRTAEVEVSTVRRRLHQRIDDLQAEIGRRYRDGEASIDSFLA